MNSSGFYLISGPFGTGKTNYAAKRMSAYVNKEGYYILTDIKHYFGNSNVYQVDGLIETGDKKHPYEYALGQILELMYQIYDIRYTHPEKTRSNRPRFMIYLDECGVVFDRYDSDQKALSRIKQYILQIRKLNGRIYLISQEHSLMSLSIRSLIRFEYRCRNIFNLNFRPFKLFCEIREREIDPENSTVVRKQVRSYRNKEFVEEVQDFHYDYYYRPTYWHTYDDLYINVKLRRDKPLPDNYLVILNDILQKHVFKKTTGFLKRAARKIKRWVLVPLYRGKFVYTYLKRKIKLPLSIFSWQKKNTQIGLQGQEELKTIYPNREYLEAISARSKQRKNDIYKSLTGIDRSGV